LGSLEDLAQKTMQRETFRDNSLKSRYSGTRGGMHIVSGSGHLESRFASLENMMKELVPQ